MKAVLISIRPEWCELIANGKKTIEVRKTRPKLEIPFKCYIYQTMTGYVSKSKENDILVPTTYGKVIGEFVCDEIAEIGFSPYYHGHYYPIEIVRKSCVPFDDMYSYLGEKHGYSLHISDLVIYDKPKELSEFRKSNYVCPREDCEGCYECVLTRPPQSWCYVEER